MFLTFQKFSCRCGSLKSFQRCFSDCIHSLCSPVCGEKRGCRITILSGYFISWNQEFRERFCKILFHLCSALSDCANAGICPILWVKLQNIVFEIFFSTAALLFVVLWSIYLFAFSVLEIICLSIFLKHSWVMQEYFACDIEGGWELFIRGSGEQ